MTGDRRPREDVDEDIDEVAENIRVLVEGEMEAQHQLAPHQPRVAQCPACRRLGAVA